MNVNYNYTPGIPYIVDVSQIANEERVVIPRLLYNPCGSLLQNMSTWCSVYSQTVNHNDALVYNHLIRIIGQHLMTQCNLCILISRQ